MPGHFEGDQFIPNGEEQKAVYSNISPRTWFGGYISLAHDYNMVKDANTWKIAREVTDEDIEIMIQMYLMDEEGEMIDGIETEYGTYYITYDEDRLTIKKVHKPATSTSNNTST